PANALREPVPAQSAPTAASASALTRHDPPGGAPPGAPRAGAREANDPVIWILKRDAPTSSRDAWVESSRGSGPARRSGPPARSRRAPGRGRYRPTLTPRGIAAVLPAMRLAAGVHQPARGWPADSVARSSKRP